MIQFNLLPDVKVSFIKTKRTKRMVVVMAVAVCAVSVGLLFVLFSFVAVQKQHVSNLDQDIKSLTKELEETPDLTRILSIQNQLNTLPALYDGRPAADRLPGYIDQTTPVGIRINEFSQDYSTSTIEILGEADSLELVNSFADTLKYTKYKQSGEETAATNAFTKVVLSEFARDKDKASFTLSFNFDPVIFDITKSVELIVPNLVTTRAQAPESLLFNIQPQEAN